MSPEEALIRAVETDPTSDLPRLVYADWLDENGREPFADFLRTELELAKLPLDSPNAPPLRERLWQAWAAVDAVWLHRFTQPKMLRANPTPFPAGWRGFGLGQLRDCGEGYGFYDYDSLPQLDAIRFLGSFAYLAEPPLSGHMLEEYAPDYADQFYQMLTDAEDAGLALPAPFTRFMAEYPQINSFGSVNGPYFTPPDDVFPMRPAFDASCTHVMCYLDSSSLLLWDLFVHPSGASCVIVHDDEYFELPPQFRKAWFVAPSFQAFVYRMWLEYQVRQQLAPEPTELTHVTRSTDTPEIQAYIDHYRRGEPRA